MVYYENCTSCHSISSAEEMNPEFKETMEDSYRIVDGFMKLSKCGLYAIFDGHGGLEVAEYLQTQYEHFLQHEIELNPQISMETLLKRSFLLADLECCKISSTAGATAVVCLIREEMNENLHKEKILYTANVGDCRAVLCPKDQPAQRLSLDHKAEDPREIERIEELGGFVLRGRVMGILAVARAFGDQGIKQYISAMPYTSKILLPTNSSETILILACDGLWDVFTDEEAKSVVENISNRSKASEILIQKAIHRGSTDNITCLVVYF